jgi:phage N-6-adenine-methyltransferase
MNNELFFSSVTDEWGTPKEVFAVLNEEFGFTLDPCSNGSNGKTARCFTLAENGLLKSWRDETVFLNPPYSDIERWMAKAYGAARDDNAIVVCLVPSRTDTKWWHKYAMRGEIRFICGRLRFGDAEASAPFPSAIVIFRPRQFRLESWPERSY